MFVILVLMAVATTLMTGPALELIQKIYCDSDRSKKPGKKILTILLPFARTETAVNLLRLTEFFLDKKQKAECYCIHISRNDIMTEKAAQKRMDRIFSPIRKVALKTGQLIKTDFRFTANVAEEISNFEKTISPDLLLTGSSQSIFSRNPLGGKTRSIAAKTNTNNAVFIDNGQKISAYAIVKADNNDSRAEMFIREKLQSGIKPAAICDMNRNGISLSAFIAGLAEDHIIVMEKSLWVSLGIEDKKHSFLLIEWKKEINT